MFAETQSKRLLSYDSCLVLAQNQIITNDFYSYYLYSKHFADRKKNTQSIYDDYVPTRKKMIYNV